jgi:GT2 family glycosyltransferase
MSTVDLLVAIPTHNRADLVANAVRSLMQQANASRRWSVLVVDNASTDNTHQLIRHLTQEWPSVRLVSESQLGSSHARNRATRESEASYILFVDDECIFPSDYIDRALAIIDERKPKMFGGPVYPWYREPPPTWFRDRYGSYSLPHATGRAKRIFFSGANMGFDRQSVLELGGFDSSLGMLGRTVGYGEETDLELRLLERFGPDCVWFDTEFINYHLVLPSKYNWGPLLREHFARGLARAHVSARAGVACHQDRACIPESLRPRTPPTAALERLGWQNIAYEYGLPLVRILGYVIARLGFVRN